MTFDPKLTSKLSGSSQQTSGFSREQELKDQIFKTGGKDHKLIIRLIYLCNDRKNYSAMHQLSLVYDTFRDSVMTCIKKTTKEWRKWEAHLDSCLEKIITDKIHDRTIIDLVDILYTDSGRDDRLPTIAGKEIFRRMYAKSAPVRDDAAVWVYRLFNLATLTRGNDNGLVLWRMEQAAREIAVETGILKFNIVEKMEKSVIPFLLREFSDVIENSNRREDERK